MNSHNTSREINRITSHWPSIESIQWSKRQIVKYEFDVSWRLHLITDFNLNFWIEYFDQSVLHQLLYKYYKKERECKCNCATTQFSLNRRRINKCYTVLHRHFSVSHTY